MFCLENGRVRHLTPENSPLPHKEIVNLKEDRYGNLWIGSVRQPLVCYNPDLGTVSKHMYPDGHLISALDFYYDHGDKMYIGTTYGLCVMDITTKKAERLLPTGKGPGGSDKSSCPRYSRMTRTYYGWGTSKG
ncbi:two-component regulator propeller domain-containing protein [Bacteroides rodentium]|uniref:two-component regulator propeller domain-containing protein n=1 Tax=Bacteroides rodentium TaxID=691816 RepID=UPI001FCBE8A0|nr:two-component regulator propeller domain-containing protein [Bacteroides rodentium]